MLSDSTMMISKPPFSLQFSVFWAVQVKIVAHDQGPRSNTPQGPSQT